MKLAKGNKVVNIVNNGSSFIALYCQIIEELGQVREQVLADKTYATEKACIKWANKMLEA